MLRIKCAELCALLHVTKNIDVLKGRGWSKIAIMDI